ncbi:hypothetical protein B0T18DRAFT_174089 [Schizothecium vesticola]|uniref:Uncharacterized protein n=1 Tax=Schizothecium vesticola TaxID=314040 RepID=A0AA40EPC8_9PEZI|nr:hypothetical protein B0T18DRAFT_174089 [Schizothecium vesticola]
MPRPAPGSTAPTSSGRSPGHSGSGPLALKLEYTTCTMTGEKHLLSRSGSIGSRARPRSLGTTGKMTHRNNSTAEHDAPSIHRCSLWQTSTPLIRVFHITAAFQCELYIHHFGIPPRRDDARDQAAPPHTHHCRDRRGRPVGWPRLLGGVVFGMLFNAVDSAACYPTHHQRSSTQRQGRLALGRFGLQSRWPRICVQLMVAA